MVITVTIQNRLNQRININLNGRRNLDLLAKGTARISEEELSAPHLQGLIAKGDIVVLQTSKTKHTPIKPSAEHEKRRADAHSPESGSTANEQPATKAALSETTKEQKTEPKVAKSSKPNAASTGKSAKQADSKK